MFFLLLCNSASSLPCQLGVKEDGLACTHGWTWASIEREREREWERITAYEMPRKFFKYPSIALDTDILLSPTAEHIIDFTFLSGRGEGILSIQFCQWLLWSAGGKQIKHGLSWMFITLFCKIYCLFSAMCCAFCCVRVYFLCLYCSCHFVYVSSCSIVHVFFCFC